MLAYSNFHAEWMFQPACLLSHAEKALTLVSSLNMLTHTDRAACWANVSHSNWERLRSMAALTFGDSNGVFSSLLITRRQLTHADIYIPGSSARVLPLAKAISPVLISPVLVAMPTSALTGELVSLCFSLLCKCAPLRAGAQACYGYMKASIPSAASHHLYL